MQPLLYKTKQFFFVLIKLSLVVGSCYFIYYKITNNDALKFPDFIDFLKEKRVLSLKNILFLCFLTLLNWFFEIYKWKVLVRPIKKISFKNALEQNLGALTASLFTPNRIGEYGAKAIYYAANYRKRIMLIKLFGNLLQMSITVVLGIIGLLFFITKYKLNINQFKLGGLTIIILVILVLIFISIRKSTISIKGFTLEKLKRFTHNYPKTNIISASVFSLVRYLVFSFQFYILLLLFGTDLNYLNAMMIITSMYLLASVIPSIFIFDVIIRGSVAVYLFSFASVNQLTVLSIITIMWLLNFVIPSLIGSYYVLTFKLPQTEQ
ncbi:lysylphosphatidylglycerol synthase domain-containing protein [uncultured Algibacter sp.]|uniref:lysylphosphatidylglycerol synthase domain-containing protein n=1 Tax=uncultured Algibacter sp. TaxID=298659 RepID=UPI003216C40F